MKKTTLPHKRSCLSLIMLFISFLGLAQSQTFNNPANNESSANQFTVPAGVTSVTFQSWGAGGGGSSISGAAGGGGGGAYTEGTITGLTPGDIITIYVGTGGGIGTSGQNTTINSTIIANGGASSNSRTGGAGGAASAISGFITASFAGGNGGNARSSQGGGNNEGGGGGGGSASASALGGGGGNGGGTNGGTGGTGFASGGVGAAADGTPDAGTGSNPGAGGGGRGEGSSTSKAGGSGQVILSWVVSLPPTITSLGATNGCIGGSITINGTNLSGATASNVKIGGTAVSSITSNSGTVLVAIIGTGTTGTVSVTTPAGTATSATTFTMNPLPTASAGSSLLNICKGGTTVALGGSFGGSATSAVWSTTSGGTFANNTGNTPNTTTWTPPATFTGTATLVLTTAGGSCGTTTASKTQLVNEPTANAGSALATICQGQTTVALGGSYAGSATGAVWSDGGIGGTFTNNSGTTPGTTTWTPPAAYTGTATLTLTTIGGPCGTTTDFKTQIVNTGSFATVGSAQKIYASFTSASLGGNAPGGTSGTWTKIFGPGTVTFSSSTSATATATVSAYGAYVFRWTLTGSCGVTTADINVTYAPFKDPEYTIVYQNFDNSDGGWLSSGTTGSWGYTNTASSVHSGEGNFWAVNTTSSKYPNNALTYLTSPTVNTTGFKNVKLFIDVRYDTSSDTQDGMQIQYSTNNGTTWSVLGDNSAPTFWYTTNGVNALSSSLSNTNGWNNSNSTAAAPLSQFEERSIQASVLDNSATLKFRAVFASNSSTTDAGVAIDNVIIKGDPIVAFSDPVTGPGSINSDLKLWLKSNTGTSTTTDGTALATWNDQAFDNNSVGITGNSPVYRNNATRNINYNPVIDFTAASSQVMKGKGGYWSQDYYVVIKTNGLIDNTAATRQVPISGRMATSTFNVDGTALGLGNFTARYTNEMVSHNISSIPTAPPTDVKSYGRAYTSTTDSYNQETIIFNIKTNSSGTATEIYKNGKRIDNTTGQTVLSDQVTFSGTMNFSELNNSQYNLGVGRFTLAGNAASYLNGRMTEVVSYSSPKSAIEQQKIQSYLGIKNGITLHDTNSTTPNDLCDVNYIDSSENIIWDITNNNGYNYDIAGIGRDDNTLLNQKQSKTENPTPDISIGLGDLLDVNSNNPNTFDNDKKFLVWGNNHGTLAAQTPVIVNMSSGITPALTTDVSFISVGRTWKVVETGGNIPTTKVSIPTTMLSATLTPPGDYLMFISNTPNFDPTAEYRVMTANGSNLETLYDFDGIKYITFGFAPEKTFTRCIKFDGTNDYLDAGKVLDLTPAFTVSAWVNRNTANKTILSKRNNTFTEGYDLSINAAGKAEMSWYAGVSKKTITSSAVIPSGKWHHIGVTFDGTIAKMYVDGINAVSSNLAGIPTATTQSFLIAAADGVSTTSFFNGSIDEVRVWNVALTDAQLRYVMNQEILNNAATTNGNIVPNTITLNEISSIPWANLKAYYPMSTYTYTNAKDISNNNNTAALRNLTTVDRQTAPLPYESAANGAWETAATWTNSSLQDLPNSISIEDTSKTINWNIVKSTHTITSTTNKTVLGFFVTSNTISATNDSKIEVSHYLKLDGKIDLVGKSQLIQTEGSDLDVTSSGSIERDQQGQSNLYNYNYWCSPVSPTSTSSNNNNYSISGVMRDGTHPSAPVNINWVSGYDGATTSPISLARYWLNTFDNYVNDYSNWNQIQETTPIRVGQGFTLKGSGASGSQNYVFTGKPNNGTINTNSVGKDQLLLTGNPYPSALDAEAFINDNSSSIDGTLYFWEHFSSNNTHVLKDYQGGYAERNYVGGLPPVSPSLISGLGSSTKTPGQFVPVGQGFFVNGNLTTGGAVTFKNSQRSFHKEDETGVSNSVFKTTSNKKTLSTTGNNLNDPIVSDSYMKIRLGHNANNSYHRQVLLGFMNERATSEIDYGYDALNIDDFSNDMYFLVGENQLVIQGVGHFDENTDLPIGVKADAEGKVSFVIDALENFAPEQAVFIYDNLTDTYHNIREQAYEVDLPAGTNDSRFSLRFKDKTLKVEQNSINDINITHIQNGNILVINNNLLDVTVEKVTLYNILGQSVSTWKIENQEQQNIKIPVKNISSGIYIAKVKTNNGESSKKIIIN